MSIYLRIALIAASILTMAYFLTKIKKSKAQIEDAVFWIVVSIIWILLGIFPGILGFFARLLGVESPVNLLFLAMLFILIMKNFSLTVKVSMLQSKLNNMGQTYALDKADRLSDSCTSEGEKTE